MREVVIDTETTGLEHQDGHRLIELAGVELEDLTPTGRFFHCYIDPEREVDAGAERVHGLSTAFLKGKPKFADAEVSDAFLSFIGDARLVAHNAAFDRGFINAELERIGLRPLGPERWIDTLALAQKRYPGMFNNLDALCKRFRISLSERDKHGALVDAKLLAAVYLELHGGRETRLDFSAPTGSAEAEAARAGIRRAYGPRPRPLPSRLSPAEFAAHTAFVAELGEKSLWSSQPSEG
jgi:DNA polymerase III subunit epsilon